MVLNNERYDVFDLTLTEWLLRFGFVELAKKLFGFAKPSNVNSLLECCGLANNTSYYW